MDNYGITGMDVHGPDWADSFLSPPRRPGHCLTAGAFASGTGQALVLHGTVTGRAPDDTRERASADYDEAERAMEAAARRLAGFGVHAAAPSQLRRQVSEYLGRLAAIARSGAEDPDEVLALCGGSR